MTVRKPVQRRKGTKVARVLAPQGTGRKPPIQEDERGWSWPTMGNKMGPSRIRLQNGRKGKRNK